MKKFILGLFIAVIGIQTAFADNKTKFCNSLAQVSEAVYEARAAGVPKSIAVKAAVENMNKNSNLLLVGLSVVEEIYSLPSSYVRPGAGSLMGTQVFNACIGTKI